MPPTEPGFYWFTLTMTGRLHVLHVVYPRIDNRRPSVEECADPDVLSVWLPKAGPPPWVWHHYVPVTLIDGEWGPRIPEPPTAT